MPHPPSAGPELLVSLELVRARIRDAADICRRARSPMEVVKALAPAQLLTRRVLGAEPPSGGSERRLSSGKEPPDTRRLASTASARMRALANRLKAEAISDDGRRVDYRALIDSPLLAELDEAVAELREVTPEAFGSDADRVAFWVNLYNTLVIHGIVALRIERSVMEVPSFFGTVAYRVGQHTFTPDEIENGVLRRNGRHPATRRRLFAAEDARLAYCPAEVDARIHCALVCAARGCPPIGVYAAEGLDAQLDAAATAFVNGDVTVDDDARRIELSTIFRYYPDDFGGETGVVRFIRQYAAPELAASLEAAIDAGYALHYRSYDWDLNAHG